jgi:hypothetical protein
MLSAANCMGAGRRIHAELFATTRRAIVAGARL